MPFKKQISDLTWLGSWACKQAATSTRVCTLLERVYNYRQYCFVNTMLVSDEKRQQRIPIDIMYLWHAPLLDMHHTKQVKS